MKKISVVIFQLSLILMGIQGYCKAQKNIDPSKKFQTFEELIRSHKQDTTVALNYANAWLTLAKNEQDIQQQLKAYQHIIHLVEKKYRMIYADSLLNTALSTKDNALIGSAYVTIGAAHYNNRVLNDALDHYLLAYNYISKTNDKYLIHKVKYTIAQTKYHLGFYDEAIMMFSECINFFKEENSTAYIKSLHGIALCYNNIERYDLCSFNNQLGLKLSNQLEVFDMIPYFKNSEGINQYKLKNYKQALALLKESLIEIEKKNDETNQIVTWFYLGKTYWAINKKDQAVDYFYKVMNAIELKNFIRPDIRENFELLISYHSENNDLQRQLFTIEKLLDYDTQLSNSFKYLSYKVHKDYDTKSLLQRKQKIKEELARNKTYSIAIISSLGVLIIAISYYHFYSKKNQKQKFDRIMKELTSNRKNEMGNNNSIATISPEVTNDLLQNLKKFEANKKYIEKNMTLTKLATQLHTNTKYASLIIAHHRGKKTTTYINDLKIDYIVEQLVNNPKFRKYTNKALAEEVGFGSTQIFTQCFKNKIGMSPTSFINHLNNSQENKSL